MFVGVLIFSAIVTKVTLFSFEIQPTWVVFKSLLDHRILEIVASGLALSAGFELAYMLFTLLHVPFSLSALSLSVLILAQIDGML